MKRVVSLLALFVLCCLVATIAEAKGKGGKKGPATPEQTFKDMDKDSNGKLSQAEYVDYEKIHNKKFDQAKAEKAFQKIGKGGDVTVEKFKEFKEEQKKKAAEKKGKK